MEFERVSTPVEVVLIAYRCGLAVDVIVVAIRGGGGYQPHKTRLGLSTVLPGGVSVGEKLYLE